jgi:hypothetical protein
MNTGPLSTLVVGIVTGVLGVAYIAYGRRQTKFAPLIAGVFLCAYPYFIDSLVWLVSAHYCWLCLSS